MNHQNVLSHRVDGLQFSLWPQLKAEQSVARQGTPATQKSGAENYLPGLRAVENEVETYFKNDFVWLGY